MPGSTMSRAAQSLALETGRPAAGRRNAGLGCRGGVLEAKAPPDGVAEQSLVHRVKQGLAGVAVGQMAEPAAARLADPAGGGGLAVIRAVPQEEVDAPLVIR